MHFEPDDIYHVYNRGNNKQPIFFHHFNYLYFIRKLRNWLPFCDLLSYNLMPNHFHVMLKANEHGCEQVWIGEQPSYLQELSKIIGNTLSSYAQGINRQNGTTGSLFQKKTKAKCITLPPKNLVSSFTPQDYLRNCFEYIHQNPIEARLVKDLRLWQYSSWLDYYGGRNGTLCNKELTAEILDLTNANFLDPDGFGMAKGPLLEIW